MKIEKLFYVVCMPITQIADWSIEEIPYSLGEIPDKPKGNNWKTIYLKLIVVGLVAFVLVSLINLQVVQGAMFKQQADNNRIYLEPIAAPRGLIYDRNGVPLVFNKDIFSCIIDANLLNAKTKDVVFTHLSNILQLPTSTIANKYASGVKAFVQDIAIADNLSQIQMIQIIADPVLTSVVRVEPKTIREYPYTQATASLLGYVGQVSADDLQTHPGLNPDDTIGKDGLEYQYDNALRGVDGENVVEVDSTQQKVTIIKTQAPIPGKNIYLSIDINVQKTLFDDVNQGMSASGATGGAAIVQNPKDGSILAMVSEPTYDDNMFADGISASDYAKLINDPNFPLLNRAIAETVPPGSIMKTITGSAALQKKDINIGTTYDDPGTFELGGHTYQDYDKIGRGVINIVGGLQWSSNDFFYNVINKYLSLNDFIAFQKLYGLGAITGIDLPGEKVGTIATPEYKQSTFQQVWYTGDSLNAAIGQGYTLVTPIQVVNWISSIVNDGTLYTPHLVENIGGNDTIKANVVRKGFVDKDNLAIIKEGMHAAVLSGIDNTMFTKTVDVAGKTGTAEFGVNNEFSHAWASGFAPFNSPQISFLVFLEKGGLSSNAERVAKKFLDWYFGDYIKKP